MGNTYFFVSTKVLNKIEPRIPKTISKREDNIVPRICVSKSLMGAIQSTSIYEKHKRFYIYTCMSNKVITQMREQVDDEYLFGDEWVLEPVELKLYKTVFVERKRINGNIVHYRIYSKDEEVEFGFYDYSSELTN